MKKLNDLERFEREQRKAQRKERIKRNINETLTWINDNKTVLLVVIPATATLVKTGVKMVNKQVSLRKEQQLKDLYCYDRAQGHYWRLKRKLSSKEWIEISERREQGEKLATILNEMNLIKK